MTSVARPQDEKRNRRIAPTRTKWRARCVRIAASRKITNSDSESASCVGSYIIFLLITHLHSLNHVSFRFELETRLKRELIDCDTLFTGYQMPLAGLRKSADFQKLYSHATPGLPYSSRDILRTWARVRYPRRSSSPHPAG